MGNKVTKSKIDFVDAKVIKDVEMVVFVEINVHFLHKSVPQ